MSKQRSSSNIDISIIIPAYGEEKTIRGVVLGIKELFRDLKYNSEILVINDGSLDNTSEEAKIPKVRVLNLRKNMGKGIALQLGFKHSSGKHILTVDADGSHTTSDIRKLTLTYFNENYDMLIGSRFIERPKRKFTSSFNLIGNKIFSLMIFLMTNTHISDSQSGLRIFNRKVIKRTKIQSKGYEIESELTIKSIKKGYSLGETSIECLPRYFGVSHLNSFKDGFKIIKTLLFSYLTD